MDKVVLGFSGGVDSSVAALLLADAGYQVHGLYLDTGGGAPEELYPAAERLGFPLTVLDVRAAMEERVCRPFAQGYLSVISMFAHLHGSAVPSIMYLPIKVIDSGNIAEFIN